MDQISSQLRIVRPVAWNKTEVISQCIGVKGESAEARRNRIRQFEDFFNVSGLGTPDDLVEFREQQKVFRHVLNVGAIFRVVVSLGNMAQLKLTRFRHSTRHYWPRVYPRRTLCKPTWTLATSNARWLK